MKGFSNCETLFVLCDRVSKKKITEFSLENRLETYFLLHAGTVMTKVHYKMLWTSFFSEKKLTTHARNVNTNRSKCPIPSTGLPGWCYMPTTWLLG